MVYKGYEKEHWYKELLSMQQQQRRINKRECYTLLIDHPAEITGKPIVERQVAMVRSVGRPKKFTDVHIALVKKLYDEANGKISVRKLTRAVELAGISMSRETIRSYMKQFQIDK